MIGSTVGGDCVFGTTVALAGIFVGDELQPSVSRMSPAETVIANDLMRSLPLPFSITIPLWVDPLHRRSRGVSHLCRSRGDRESPVAWGLWHWRDPLRGMH